MKRKYLYCLVFVITVSASAFAEEKMRVAILDLKGKNVSKVIAVGVSNMIRSDLVDTGMFTVVERNQMSEILKEQQFQLTGCTDSACAVQVGKLLSAQKILVGDITRMGTSYMITVRIVDVEKGIAEYSSKEKAKSVDTLDTAASNLTGKLIGRITGKTRSELLAGLEQRTMTGYWLRSTVPGWGQFYADRKIEGALFATAFTAGIVFAGWAYYDYNDKKSAYEDLPSGSTEFDSSFDAYDKAGKIYDYSIYILAGIYAVHLVDAVFFARPDFGKKKSASSVYGPFIRIAAIPVTEDSGARIGVAFGYRF